MSKETTDNPRTTPAKAKLSQEVKLILGAHSHNNHFFGELTLASDCFTETGIPHRALIEAEGQRENLVACMRQMLIRQHATPEALARDRRRRKAMKELGCEAEQNKITRFPQNTSTQKGNLAEIVLAEYLVCAADVDLPIYRLHHNPNIDQSMKGDDVLAFDLDSDPVRIIIGESKFRSVSSKHDVVEIVDALTHSYRARIPTSLQFVADCLFNAGNVELGEKIANCALLLASNKLILDYVGLLMSDRISAKRVNKHAVTTIRRLALISFGIDDPNSIINPCYNGLEEQE